MANKSTNRISELQTAIKEKDKEAQIAEISREKEITNVASNLEIQKNELKAQLEKIKEKNITKILHPKGY